MAWGAMAEQQRSLTAELKEFARGPWRCSWRAVALAGGAPLLRSPCAGECGWVLHCSAFSLACPAAPRRQLLLGIGFCGSLTTFSSWMLDAMQLISAGQIAPIGFWPHRPGEPWVLGALVGALGFLGRCLDVVSISMIFWDWFLWIPHHLQQLDVRRWHFYPAKAVPEVQLGQRLDGCFSPASGVHGFLNTCQHLEIVDCDYSCSIFGGFGLWRSDLKGKSVPFKVAGKNPSLRLDQDARNNIFRMCCLLNLRRIVKTRLFLSGRRGFLEDPGKNSGQDYPWVPAEPWVLAIGQRRRIKKSRQRRLDREP